MIKSITVTNYVGETLTVTLTEADPASGLLLIDADGLGPAKGKINSTEIATSDGSIFNSARLETRNITLTFRFTFSPKIEDARQLTYKYFPLKKPITVFVETDNRTVYTVGYVEANEPDIWSKNEGCQISIICPYPYFYDAIRGTNSTVFSGVEPMFEFPFENDDVVEPLLIMGEIFRLREKDIIYDGDSDVGLVFDISAIGTVKNLVLFKTLHSLEGDTYQSMSLDTDKLEALTGQGFVAGDEIIINTNTGLKSATLIRDGVQYNILNCISRDADWLRLEKGHNDLAYAADEGIENILMYVNNNIIYEGI